jgi:hypothetical protein
MDAGVDHLVHAFPERRPLARESRVGRAGRQDKTLLGMPVKSKSTGAPMRWPANLVVFVNEAQEATRSYQLIESFAANLPVRDAQAPFDRDPPEPSPRCIPAVNPTQSPAQRSWAPEPPAIVSISSTGDQATRVAFTGVQALQRPFNSLRSYDNDDPNLLGFKRQTPMFLNTTAHLKPFHHT